VLVVTLGLLVLSSILLVAVGRSAVRHALAAREAQEELQRRWGTVTCQNAVLPFAENILANAEAQQKRPAPVLRAKLQLGGQIFTLVLCDEQAKANVNTLLESESDRFAVETRLRQSFSGSGLMSAIRLHPAPLRRTGVAKTQPGTIQPGGAAAGVPRWISGMGQVFDSVAPATLIDGTSVPPALRLTCWGGGAINIMRASEPSLLLATSPPLSRLDIGRIIDVRNARFARAAGTAGPSLPNGAVGAPAAASTDPIAAMLVEAKVDLKNRPKLSLTTISSCHSLWVIVGDAQRPWYYLAVSDESNPQHPRIEAFVW
jgi:hypothetical protein